MESGRRTRGNPFLGETHLGETPVKNAHPEQATGQHAGRPADEQLNIEQETQPAQAGSSVDLGHLRLWLIHFDIGEAVRSASF